MKRNQILAVAGCLFLAFLATQLWKKPPVATLWRDREFILTNTSDDYLHHIKVRVESEVDDRFFVNFLVTLAPHESQIYQWQDRNYLEAEGGRVSITCNGYYGTHRYRIKKSPQP